MVAAIKHNGMIQYSDGVNQVRETTRARDVWENGISHRQQDVCTLSFFKIYFESLERRITSAVTRSCGCLVFAAKRHFL